MANKIPTGMAQTVMGPISPDKLGLTDPHEHLLLDFSFAFKPPPEATEGGRCSSGIPRIIASSDTSWEVPVQSETTSKSMDSS